MASQTQLFSVSNPRDTYQGGQGEMQKTYLGRKVVPAAHNGAAGGGMISILLIVGAILWGLGVAQGNPDMILAGQVLVGLELGFIALGLLVAACVCACTVCDS